MELLVVLSGVLAGAVAWLPCGVGLAAHRYKQGGAIIKSTNKLVLLGTREPGSFSILGRVVFFFAVLGWLGIFFGAMVVPGLVAKVLGVSQSSPFVGYAVFANFAMAALSFVCGPVIWRKLAL